MRLTFCFNVLRTHTDLEVLRVCKIILIGDYYKITFAVFIILYDINNLLKCLYLQFQVFLSHYSHGNVRNYCLYKRTVWYSI